MAKKSENLINLYKILGSTEDVTTCECCGRSDLKKTIIMGLLDLDGNLVTEQFFGVVCAAKNSGRKAKDVHKEAKAADNHNRLQAAREVVEEVSKLDVPEPKFTHYEPENPMKAGLKVIVGDCEEDVWEQALNVSGVEGVVKRVVKKWVGVRRLELGKKYGFKSAYEIWEYSKGLR